MDSWEPVSARVVGRLAEVLVGRLYSDGGLLRYLQLGVDPVVEDVEEARRLPGFPAAPAPPGSGRRAGGRIGRRGRIAR